MEAARSLWQANAAISSALATLNSLPSASVLSTWASSGNAEERLQAEKFQASLDQVAAQCQLAEETVAKFRDEAYMSDVKATIIQQNKRRRWKKKHLKNLRAVREARERRQEDLHKETDEWRQQCAAREARDREERARKRDARLAYEAAEKHRSKVENYQQLLDEIEKLYEARRSKALPKGLVDPMADAAFSSQMSEIRSSVAREYEACSQQHQEASAAQSSLNAFYIQAGAKDALDFYGRPGENLEFFISVRTAWDNYIVPKNAAGGSRVPAMWVPVVPASRPEWAEYIGTWAKPPKIKSTQRKKITRP